MLSMAATLIALIAALVLWGVLGPESSSPRVRVDPDASAEQAIPDRAPLVYDPEAGWRGPRSTEVEMTMGGIGAVSPDKVTRRSNNMGFIRGGDLPDELVGPRILVLGDSHTMGVVGTEDNLGPVLEGLLRASPATPEALVLNAGCAFYSLYQYLLRARTLAPKYSPSVLLIVVFVGNDFLELERQSSPYLTDALVESRANPSPPPETTTARRMALNLPGDLPNTGAFWQGLNQAAYFYRNPARIPLVKQKAKRCLEMLGELSDAQDFDLLFALLPSIDLTFPDHIAKASEEVRDVIESGLQEDFHNWFATQVRARGFEVVDLLPVFRADNNFDLYASDCHIWRRGHRLVAESVREPILTLLRR